MTTHDWIFYGETGVAYTTQGSIGKIGYWRCRLCGERREVVKAKAATINVAVWKRPWIMSVCWGRTRRYE